MLTALIESRVHLCEFLGSSLTGYSDTFFPDRLQSAHLLLESCDCQFGWLRGTENLLKWKTFVVARACSALNAPRLVISLQIDCNSI
jgi:hypothetical protein